MIRGVIIKLPRMCDVIRKWSIRGGPEIRVGSPKSWIRAEWWDITHQNVWSPWSGL